MPRPFWSGRLQISLVSFGINLFPATEAKSEIRFHQLSRKTGERIRHQKVIGDTKADPIENDEIVKGYEYRKGEYVTLEPHDIENLRIPSRHSLDIVQFVSIGELNPELYEKPYFVVPEDKQQTEAFAVIRKALQSTRKVALGKIAFGGREHLVAISAPPEETERSSAGRGMMAYTLRYAEELRNPTEYFGEIVKASVDSDQLSLAKELIKRKTAPFDPGKFHDEYEAALKELVEAKVNNAPPPKMEPTRKTGKVVNLMDALRRSVQPESLKKNPRKKNSSANSPGLRLVTSTQKTGKATRPRKSA